MLLVLSLQSPWWLKCMHPPTPLPDVQTCAFPLAAPQLTPFPRQAARPAPSSAAALLAAGTRSRSEAKEVSMLTFCAGS